MIYFSLGVFGHVLHLVDLKFTSVLAVCLATGLGGQSVAVTFSLFLCFRFLYPSSFTFSQFCYAIVEMAVSLNNHFLLITVKLFKEFGKVGIINNKF